MIRKLFKFWQKSKEQQAINLALKLRKVLIELDFYVPAKNPKNCTRIDITEWSSDVTKDIELSSSKNYTNRIRFDKSGKIIK